jgi:hypothetical protein
MNIRWVWRASAQIKTYLSKLISRAEPEVFKSNPCATVPSPEEKEQLAIMRLEYCTMSTLKLLVLSG